MAKDFSSLGAWFNSLSTLRQVDIGSAVVTAAHADGRDATDEDYRKAFIKKYVKGAEAHGVEPAGLDEDIPGLADITGDE